MGARASRTTRRGALAMVMGSIAVACSGASDGPVATAPDAAAGENDVDETRDSTDDDSTDAAVPTIVSDDADHAEVVAALAGLLPGDTRGVFAVDLAAISDESSVNVGTLLDGGGIDPMLTEFMGPIGALAGAVDAAGVMTTALLAQTTDAADGLFLLARVRSESIDDLLETAPTPDDTYGPSSHPLYVDSNGSHLTLLPGGVLLVGGRAVVESVLDVVDGADPADRARSSRTSTR